MFESAELGHKVSRDDYRREREVLREQLLDAQFELAEKADFPVLIMIEGIGGAGKGDTVNTLNEWMDPRLIDTHAFDGRTEEELARPRMWRYWRNLPPKGRIGVFFHAWYAEALNGHVDGRIDDDALDVQIEDIERLERMLAHEGALILKFWFHLSKAGQKKRLKSLEDDKHTRWRVNEQDWDDHERYDQIRSTAEHILRLTNKAYAPWIIVEGTDTYYRHLTVGKAILDALRKRLDAPEAPLLTAAPPVAPRVDNLTVLNTLDLGQTLEKPAYKDQLAKYQGKLNELSRDPRFRDHAVVAVFEGHDAAGKGGAIRRITSALDARFYKVIPVGAPTDEELSQPYLWRFWRRLPPLGQFALFDRSWYGRVLVERVEGFCRESDWIRAYGEINDFETEMARKGIVIAKFWLEVSEEEQLRRFESRRQTSFKRFKLTEEDWRNREKRAAYAAAVADMVDKTSTPVAPWHIIEADDKRFARVKILRTLCKQIEEALENDAKD